MCPVVGRRPQHAVSKLPCLVLSSDIVSLQYSSRSSLHCLAGFPCRLFLSYGLQVVTREVHRLSLRRLICPAQDHFIFLAVYIISMTFFYLCPLPDPDVGPSIFVCDVVHTSFNFGLRPQVCSVLVWSVSRGQDYKRFSSKSRCSTHNLCSEMT